MAVLGLFVERPDTGAGVAVRLEERFPRAAWSRNAVHNTLPGLVKEALLRVVEWHPSDKASLHRYEATADGVAELRAWIRRSVATPLVLRDELQAKLEFSTAEDLHAMLDELRALQTEYASEFAKARNRNEQATRLKHRRETRGEPPGWDLRVRVIQTADEAIVWGQRKKRIEDLCEHIEDELEEVERAGGSGASGDG